MCLQYVVIPTRRSMAEAMQILMSHALGDAGSPYLIGMVSLILSLSLLKPTHTGCDAVSGKHLLVKLTNNDGPANKFLV